MGRFWRRLEWHQWRGYISQHCIHQTLLEYQPGDDSVWSSKSTSSLWGASQWLTRYADDLQVVSHLKTSVAMALCITHGRARVQTWPPHQHSSVIIITPHPSQQWYSMQYFCTKICMIMRWVILVMFSFLSSWLLPLLFLLPLSELSLSFRVLHTALKLLQGLWGQQLTLIEWLK